MPAATRATTKKTRGSWRSGNTLVGVCPEQLGGLPTPRDPAEIVGDKVISSQGVDVTQQYRRGAESALMLIRLCRADFAILKYRSPACGKGMVYDGTFGGNLVPGNGVFTELLLQNGIPVYHEDELDDLPL